MFFFIFFDISSLLLRYITPAIPRSSRLDLSKNILKNIDSYLNFRTLDIYIGLSMEESDKLYRNGYLAAMSKQQPDLPKKILVIRFSSIGDIVLCSPVFRLLKLQWNSEIHWLTKSKYQFVNEPNPHIDKIYTFENDYKNLLRE